MMTKFPKDFVWGTATASYQVEGAVNEDGKGESIWDRFTHTPGKIERNENGDVTCNQYHLYRDDIQLMRQLAIQAYRFSISWSRIYPEGNGKLNQTGMDYYNRLVDELLKNGIEPWITLYHWDLPQKLQDTGGWANPSIVENYVNYAENVVKILGDRVKNWMTFNEPWCFTKLGYFIGEHAPGWTDESLLYKAVYKVLLSHGMAYKAMKALNPQVNIGITNVTHNVLSFSRTEEAVMNAVKVDAYDNRLYWDPILKGSFPEIVLAEKAAYLPEIKDEDLKVMNNYDFFGVQYYCDNILESKNPITKDRVKYPFLDYTEMEWPVTPVGIYDVLMRLTQDYNVKKITITEGGSAWHDILTPEGKVHDLKRQDYLKQHLIMVSKAIEDKAPIDGYFVWSLLDNFEWACGYRPRFGLIYTDYATQKRYVKDSGYIYSEIIKNNGF